MLHHRIHWRDRRRSHDGRTTRRVWSRGAILVMAALLSLGVFTNGVLAKSSILQPGGPVADRIRLLTWIIFIVAAVVFVIVVAFLLVGVFRAPHDFTDPIHRR